MTIHEMQIFVEVAKAGGMTAAARNLFVAQSTVSQSIRSIERQYGVMLFDRGPRHFAITEQGKLLLDYSQQILELHRKLEQDLKYTGGSVIRIGFTFISSSCILPTLLPNYHRTCPDVRTQICVEEQASLQAKLLGGQLDFAILEDGLTHPGLAGRAVYDDPYVLVCGAGSPFFTRDTVTLDELQGQRLLLRERGNPTRELFERVLGDRVRRFAPETLYNIDVIKAEVAAGRGVSILTRRLIAAEAAEGQLRGIPIQDFAYDRTFHLTYSRRLSSVPCLQQFRDICPSLI